MRRFLVFLLVISFAGLGAMPAHSQSLKKVSPSKYQQKTPLKGFVYRNEEAVKDYTDLSFPDGLYKVYYRNDELADSVVGLIDKRGKKAEWLLQPHYDEIWSFANNTVIAWRAGSTDRTMCIIRVGESDCTPTEFRSIGTLAYHKFDLPDWVNGEVLKERGDGAEGTITVQLFSPDGAPLIRLANVMYGRNETAVGNKYSMKAYKLDDNGLSIRIKSPEGEISDLILQRQEDGSFTQTVVPPFSIVEGSLGFRPVKDGQIDMSKPHITYSAQELMFTADVGLQLVWPYYEVEGGFRQAPADLLGLMPLSFRFDDNVADFRQFGDQEAALHFCCSLPLGWAVAWAGEDGPVFAVLPQKRNQAYPTYEEVMASRGQAVYNQIEKLWKPASEQWGLGYRDDALRAGVQIGEYAMHRIDGRVEIYQGESAGMAIDRPIWVRHTVSEAGFPAWLERTMRDKAQLMAKADAEWKAQKAAEQARKESYRRLLSEQKARMARVNREANEARAAERQASYEAARALENEQARQQAEYAAQIAAANKSRAYWSSWQTDGINDAGAGSTSRPQVDYWKSYDSSNSTGQYTTSSGAATGCRIGDSDC